MSKYLITTENTETGQTSEFAVNAASETEARESANVADGWKIVTVEDIG